MEWTLEQMHRIEDLQRWYRQKTDRLLEALELSEVNKTYRLEYAITDSDPERRNYIYVENCDLQNLDYPIHEYIEDGYDVYVLYEDDGKYYVKRRLI